jgi:hypothetical protein
MSGTQADTEGMTKETKNIAYNLFLDLFYFDKL